MTTQYTPASSTNQSRLRTFPTFLIAVFVALFSVNASGGSAEESLRGLRQLGIGVSMTTRVGRLTGLSEATILQLVSARLRGAGMEVVSDAQRKRLIGRPILFVELLEFHFAEAGAPTGVSIDISIFQDTLIVRRSNAKLLTRTWLSRAGVLLNNSDSNTNRRLAIDIIQNDIQEFIQAVKHPDK